MILFINVLITEDRMNSGVRNRGFLNSPRRMDVFKYCLASYAAIPHWTKVLLFIQLELEYQERETELKDYAKQLFGKKLQYYSWRNTNQPQWQETLQKHILDDPDPLIWFTCNDDHTFIDYDLKSIEDALNLIEPTKLQSFYFSHHPEMMKAVAMQGHKRATDNLFWVTGGNIDSIQLVTKEVLRHWWFDTNYGKTVMPRSDWRYGNCRSDSLKIYVPIKECCRHFEGYPTIPIDVNLCPPLDIPEGFFENNIKIAFCLPKPDNSWTSFNPLNSNYKISNPEGTDYKLMLEDIPLFWKDKVTEIKQRTDVPKDLIIAARNRAVWSAINSRPNEPHLVIDKQIAMSVAGR
jgi:hypothetical protein